MDQDVYGGYSKQQIGSLTTEGEGEFQKTFAAFNFALMNMPGIFKNNLMDKHFFTLFATNQQRLEEMQSCQPTATTRKKSLDSIHHTRCRVLPQGFYVKKNSCRMNPQLV